MSDFATAGGHWYAPDGSPAYTIVGANGKERPTTLRDARKLGLLPSVTGIIRMAAAPALERWKRNQVLMSAMTLPAVAGESSDAFIARVEQDWQEQGRAAADRGTAIHGAIERHYRGEPPDEDFWPWVKAAKLAIADGCGLGSYEASYWSAERSFASRIGYGGKTDLHSSVWTIDVKSKDGDPTEDVPKLYDEHLMQLAAYRVGLGTPLARCGILFVGRDAPKAQFVEATAEDLQQGWKMFAALLDFWCAKNGYRPCRT